MKHKLVTIICASLLCTININASNDANIGKIQLLNATNQVIRANLLWSAGNMQAWSVEHVITAGATVTFFAPFIDNPKPSENPLELPFSFNIIAGGITNSYCLMHHGKLDPNIKQNDLLKFDGTAILKGNDSVTHTSQYCK